VRAIVFDGKAPAVRDDVSVRDPGPTEVLVRTAAAGVCHSDVSVLDGTIPFPTPLVMGHEGAGVVEAIGSAVTTVKPGDHVVITTLANCGLCQYCNTGFPTRCRRSIGNMTKPFTVGDEPAFNFAAASVFAEATVVAETQCVAIDADVPLTSACLIGCGVLTGAGAVLHRARVQAGETAAVFGVGGVGLNVIQALRISNASRIIAIDTVPAKRDLALRFGATEFIDASAVENVVAAVRDLLPGRGGFGAGGVDWAFDCVGHPTVVRNAVECLDWGGNCVILGVPPPTAELQAVITQLTHVDRGIMGCRYGTVQPHRDVPLFIEWYKQGKLLLDELVSATYPLESFQAVIDEMHEGKLARGVLTF
jgi:Zn-dependent alcohol dehydrogenase